MKPPSASRETMLVAVAASTAAAVTVGSLLALATAVRKPKDEANETSLKDIITRLPQDSIRMVKSWILKLSGIEDQLIVLLPAAPTKRKQRQEEFEEPPLSLLILFPGLNLHPSEYVAIGKAIQKEAAQVDNLNLVVGIAVIPCNISTWILPWATNGNDPSVLANLVTQKAQGLIKKKHIATKAWQDNVYNPLMKSSVFQDLFLFGHSVGGILAIQAAYPSKYRGLLLYGASMSCLAAQTNNTHQAKKLLASYPRPVLTIMGERDGNLRCYKVAQEALALKKDLDRKLKCSAVTDTSSIKRAARLRKPVLVLPNLNHMQMAMGQLPKVTQSTGRSDFNSPIPLATAHTTLARVAVDFLQIHSTTSTTATKEAETRLLQLGRTTHTVYLEPWLRLTDPAYQCRFVSDIQRQILHVTADGKHPFHFYEDEDYEESSHEDKERNRLEVLPQWHFSFGKDFLYSKPRWDAASNQIQLQVVEQDPIAISVVPQLASTLAFKGVSPEAVLFNQNQYQETKDSPAPTLMQLNQQTFDKVLHHVVTPAQRRRYLSQGKQLRFGPDILVPRAPHWVPQPISITKVTDDNSNYYLWQSTYTTTPLSVPAPFGGVWYGKPLSPAQAYEWIVFDAFKP